MRRGCLSNKLIINIILIGMLTGCQDSGQRAKEREKFGIELFEKGDYGKAALEFNSALKEDATLATTYYYLALLNEKNRSYKAMRGNLIQVVKLTPDNIDARIKLGKIYLLFDDLDAALIEADEVLRYSKDNVDSFLLKSAVLIKQDKQGDALILIEEILQKAPKHIEAISLKALILMQNEQFDSALMLVNPVIDSGVDDVALHMLKIQLDAKQKNIDAVVADYERLVKLYPDKKEFKFALAKMYAQANRKMDAENLLREMVNSEPLEIQPKLILLDFLNSLDKEQAISQLQKYSVENQDKPRVLFQLSQWLLQKMYLSEAKTLLTKIDNLENSTDLDQQVKLQLAKIYFHNKELEKTKAIVDELFQQNPENQQAKILKAKIHMAEEQYDEAIQVLTKVLWANPNSDESLVLLAQIELAKGSLEKADKKYREALEINPANMTALTSVVSRSLRNKHNDYASELVIKALELKPNNLTLLRELAEIKMLSRDWKGTKETLETLEKQPEAALLAKFLKGKLFKVQGDCSRAISIYKDVLSVSPDFPDVLREMAICYELMGQRSQMIVFMTSFVEQNPENIVAYLIMGQLFILENNFEKAEALYNQALDIDKKVPQIYGALAKIYNEQKKYNKAIETCKLGLEENLNNVRLSLYLAYVYQEIKAYDDAIAVYEALLAVHPKLEMAINNYASLLVDFMGDKQSLEKARQLVVRFENSENAFYLDSFAWIELKSGNISGAVPLLEKVNIMAEEVAVFKFHLGVAYHEQGNNAGAVAQLQLAIDLGKQKGGFDEIEMAQQLLDDLSIAKNI